MALLNQAGEAKQTRNEEGLTNIAENLQYRLTEAATRLANITGMLVGSAPTPIASQADPAKIQPRHPLSQTLDHCRNWMQSIEGEIQRLESGL